MKTEGPKATKTRLATLGLGALALAALSACWSGDPAEPDTAATNAAEANLVTPADLDARGGNGTAPVFEGSADDRPMPAEAKAEGGAPAADIRDPAED